VNAFHCRKELFGIVAGLFVMIAFAPVAARATPTVKAFYDPADGAISLAVLAADGTPGTLAVSAFQLLSPSQLLSGSPASIPPAAISFFTILNTDESAIYEPPRQFAEIYATGLGGTLFSTSWNLGSVAQAGLTQSDLEQGFLSNGDVLAPAQPGKFLYEHNATWFAGEVVAVPEPAGTAMIGIGGLLLALALARRLSR
jgi:hypothetical protein